MNTTASRHEDPHRPGQVRPRSLWCGIALLALWGWLSLAPPGTAAPIVVPSDLNPGDQYRLAFVTSTTRNAIVPEIGIYNLFVTNVANDQPELAALGTTWAAIASTAAIDARDNTMTNPDNGPGVPIYLLNDSILAMNNGDLWDGTIINPLQVHESGSPGTGGELVWTGTTPQGRASDFPLGPSPTATVGLSFDTLQWIQGTTDTPLTALHMYAISGPLVVPDQAAVPEPSSVMLWLVGLAGVLGLRYRQRHRQASAAT
jgi:hypothetical protein